MITPFVSGPCRSGNMRKPRHLPRHFGRDVNLDRVLLRVLLLDFVSDVRSECLEKYRNAVTTPDRLGDAGRAVEPSVLAQGCVLVDRVEGCAGEQFLVERALESLRVVLCNVARFSGLRDAALIFGGC